MKNLNSIIGVTIFLMCLILSSCSVVTGIFKAGMGFGIFIVVIIILIIVFIASRASKK
jgi:hypothetical protein